MMHKATVISCMSESSVYTCLVISLLCDHVHKKAIEYIKERKLRCLSALYLQQPSIVDHSETERVARDVKYSLANENPG